MIFSSEYYEPGPAHNATHAHTCIHTHTHTHLFLFNACDNCSAWHKFPLFAKVKILLLLPIKLFRPFTHSYSSWSAPLIFKDAIRDLCANSAEICTFVTHIWFVCQICGHHEFTVFAEAPSAKLSQDSPAVRDSTFCLLSEWAVSSSSCNLLEWNYIKTRHYRILLQHKEIAKSLKKSVIIFKEESSLLFNCFIKLRLDSAICLARVFMCWFNKHVMLEYWRELR